MTEGLQKTRVSVAPVLLEQWLRRTQPESAHVHELGWLLGLIGHGLGVEVLGDRRERHGLRPLIELLDDALESAGRARTRGPDSLPIVGTAADHGPAAAWIVAELLWSAAHVREKALSWDLTRASESAALRVRGSVDGATAARLREHVESLAGVRIEIGEEGWDARFPGSMFAAP